MLHSFAGLMLVRQCMSSSRQYLGVAALSPFAMIVTGLFLCEFTGIVDKTLTLFTFTPTPNSPRQLHLAQLPPILFSKVADA